MTDTAPEKTEAETAGTASFVGGGSALPPDDV
jgi:hypothetical protein